MTLEEILQRKRERVAGFHRFERGRTALLVIDMQRGFLEKGASLEVPPGRAIIPIVKELIDTARASRVPAIFSQFVYCPALPSLRGDPFGPEHLPPLPETPAGFGRPSGNCNPGSKETESPEIVPELAPQTGELVVRGHTYDKFYGTCLDQALRALDVRCLAIAGILTDVCVNATVLGAATREYRVTVIRDAVATLWPEIQRVCLDIWDRKFARLLTAVEAMAEMRGLGSRA